MERTQRIQVYVSPVELSAIRIAAAQHNQSMSDYLRDCADKMHAAQRWIQAYEWLNTYTSSPRAAEILLSEAFALLIDGRESELDFLDPLFRTAYTDFVRSVCAGETPTMILPV